MPKTITFRPMGRLGNQLFQMAATAGLANAIGREFVVPPNLCPELRNDIEINPSKAKPTVAVLSSSSTLAKSSSSHEQMRELPFEVHTFSRRITHTLATSHAKNILMVGYFQTPEYFGADTGLVRFRHHVLEAANHALLAAQIICPARAIGVHVRRGDYTAATSSHPPCGVEYYTRAVKDINPRGDAVVVVVSDDVEWCRSNLPDAWTCVSTRSAVGDMAVMALCGRGTVMSNSTFSWWAAWLGFYSDRTVIGPKAWYGGRFAAVSTDGLFAHNLLCWHRL